MEHRSIGALEDWRIGGLGLAPNKSAMLTGYAPCAAERRTLTAERRPASPNVLRRLRPKHLPFQKGVPDCERWLWEDTQL
jgi:hypothetical protein